LNIRCLTVDDEPLALNLVSGYVERTPFLELAGRCNSAVEALRKVSEEPIDLLFLDIQMPDLSGIEFAQAMQKGPKVIFTTAFEQFALAGFRLEALDYLLKPFNYTDFLRSANKAREYFDLVQKATQPVTVPGELEYLFVKSGYDLIRIRFDDIRYISGLKDYVKIFAATSQPVLSLLSLKSLEDNLPPDRFMRVHRSYIVALDKIVSVSNHRIMIDQEYIPIGEQYKDAFYRFLEGRMP